MWVVFMSFLVDDAMADAGAFAEADVVGEGEVALELCVEAHVGMFL